MRRCYKKDWENPLQEYWSCLNVTNISKPIQEKCFLMPKSMSRRGNSSIKLNLFRLNFSFSLKLRRFYTWQKFVKTVPQVVLTWIHTSYFTDYQSQTTQFQFIFVHYVILKVSQKRLYGLSKLTLTNIRKHIALTTEFHTMPDLHYFLLSLNTKTFLTCFLNYYCI